MGARPGPGFPACPGTGPAKGALAVGGGWGLAFPALLLRPPNPGAESAGPLPPRDKCGGEPVSVPVRPVPSCLSCRCLPGKGPSSPAPHGLREVCEMLGWPSPQAVTWLLTPAVCWSIGAWEKEVACQPHLQTF